MRAAALLMPVLLTAMILSVMWVADHPAVLARSRHQVVRLDRAIADERELRGELERRLGGRVTAVSVQELDFVNDTASAIAVPASFTGNVTSPRALRTVTRTPSSRTSSRLPDTGTLTTTPYTVSHIAAVKSLIIAGFTESTSFAYSFRR